MMKMLTLFLALFISMAFSQDENDISNRTVHLLQRLAYNSGVILTDVKRIVYETEERDNKLQELDENVDNVKDVVESSIAQLNEQNEALEKSLHRVQDKLDTILCHIVQSTNLGNTF